MASSGDASTIVTPITPAGWTRHRQTGAATICIIGGSGFIGSWLTTDLRAGGSRVRVLGLLKPSQS